MDTVLEKVDRSERVVVESRIIVITEHARLDRTTEFDSAGH